MGVFFALLSLLFFQVTKRKLIFWGNQRQNIDKDVSKITLEGLTGIKTIKVLGRVTYFFSIFSQKMGARARIVSTQTTLSQLPRFFMELITILGLMMFIFFMLSSQKDVSQIITILGVFVAATFRMIPSISKIISALQVLKYYNVSLNIIYDEMKIENKEEQGEEEDLIFLKEIVVNNVSFRYKETLPDVLKKLNFVIKKGETIGFKGTSGSGKSTLADVIIGLYHPTQGEVTVDSKDIHKNVRTWQNKIGYVSQDIFLTDDSILKNVAFGISDEKINIKAVNEALDLAQLREFVDTLKEGAETIVGERGVQLSGGQRQRIGIARALYHQPEILILDEATASLDMATEESVMKSIDALKGQKTMLIIAHRLSTLKGCDIIYEIENGEIKQSKK